MQGISLYEAGMWRDGRFKKLIRVALRQTIDSCRSLDMLVCGALLPTYVSKAWKHEGLCYKLTEWSLAPILIVTLEEGYSKWNSAVLVLALAIGGLLSSTQLAFC